MRSLGFVCAATCIASLTLQGCVSPRLHTEAQLNTVARSCGLALGELIQDEIEKKVLIALRNDATAEQRVCVARWARRNGLKPVFVSMSFPS